MVRHLPHPKSIEDYGGLKPYLDHPAIAAKHNGLKYKDFRLRNDPTRKHPPSKASAAEDFGVSTKTWYSWITRDKLEQARS